MLLNDVSVFEERKKERKINMILLCFDKRFVRVLIHLHMREIVGKNASKS